MANTKKATHVVTHPRLYLAVNGKLQHVEQGHEVTLSAAQAKSLGSKVEAIKERKRLDLTAGDSKE